MSLFKKDTNHPEPKFSFGESLLVLFGILCILGYLIIVKSRSRKRPSLSHSWYLPFTVIFAALSGKP